VYTGHVEAQFESAHKNGPPGHKCAGTLDAELDFHGHSWLGIIEWTYPQEALDAYGWGPDFGQVKQIIRQYDHHNINLMMEMPSAENLAKSMYDQFFVMFGIKPDFVKLHEGHGNTMTYRGV
jgi:6-pyruvoyl-tetrahydropterin synthase